MTPRKQGKCLIILHFYEAISLALVTRNSGVWYLCLTANRTQKEIRVLCEYTIWWRSEFLPDEIPVVVLYLVEGCGIPAPGSRAQARGVWWISHEASRLCLAAGLSEWHLAQEGASLCNVPPPPTEVKQGQVTNTRWTKRTLPPLWVKGGRKNKAALTFSKNMTSYSTEVRLRCRGASQETERLLSSLCVRINCDTVTGAAGERAENIRKKHKHNAD